MKTRLFRALLGTFAVGISVIFIFDGAFAASSKVAGTGFNGSINSSRAVCENLFETKSLLNKMDSSIRKTERKVQGRIAFQKFQPPGYKFYSRLQSELSESGRILSTKRMQHWNRQIEKLKFSPIELGEFHEWGKLVSDATDRLPQIRQALIDMPIAERDYFLHIYEAILSSVVNYPRVLLGQTHERWDWSRFALIYQSIQEFDHESPKFSLYKIKRTIEGRYSLREFISCR